MVNTPDKDHIIIQQETNFRANLKTAKEKGKGHLYFRLMVESMQVNGKIINIMAMVPCIIAMVPGRREPGKIMNS